MISRDDFDVALIPGMRERLAESYKRFRAAHAAFQQEESRVAVRSTERTSCPGCGAPSGEAQLLFTSRAMRHVRCPRCRLVYTRDILADEDDRALYQPNSAMIAYLDLKDGPDYTFLESRKAAYLASLAAPHAPKAGPFLDVGCSTGALMAAARDLGFDVYGLDANPHMAARARALFGERVTTGYFPDAIPASWPSFSVISILDLLEHMVEPRAFLAELRARLADGGLLLVQVPNFDSLVIQLEGPDNGNFCHGHWQHFTATTLSQLLGSAGFAEIHRETIISEQDRIMAFPKEAVLGTLKRIAPGYEGEGNLSAEEIHRRFLGYKLVGLFRKEAS